MTTYADAVHTALLKTERPISSRALFELHDTFEHPDQVNKAIAYLVKQGRAEMAGTEKPSNGKTIRLYRALTTDEQIERQPSVPDLDAQLAAAIRERDTDTDEAVMEDDIGVDPLFGEWPDAPEDRPIPPPAYDPDSVAFRHPEGLIDANPSMALRFIDTDTDDPVIREIARYRAPRIQDGARLAKHLIAGASVLQDRLPGLATSMREAANALRDWAA